MPSFYLKPGYKIVQLFLSTVFKVFDDPRVKSSSPEPSPDLIPPQPPPVWTHTPEDVLRLTKEAIEKDQGVRNQVATLPASECNFNTVSTRPPMQSFFSLM
jgi:hypothetical protein